MLRLLSEKPNKLIKFVNLIYPSIVIPLYCNAINDILLPSVFISGIRSIAARVSREESDDSSVVPVHRVTTMLPFPSNTVQCVGINIYFELVPVILKNFKK